MARPTCPTDIQIKSMIETHQELLDIAKKAILAGTREDASYYEDLVYFHEQNINALEYLRNSLSNRKVYQKKQQIKRGLLKKMAEEHGFLQEIEDAAQAKLGKTIDELSEEDVD